MVIVDTSIAYKWFSTADEELLPQALVLLKAHLDEKDTVIAPDLLLYELANAWATKTRLSTGQIKTFLKNLEAIRIKIEPITFAAAEKAIRFSQRYHVSVYDASYAVLAQEKKCDYFTADSKFVARINLPFIKHLKEYSA